MFLNCCLQSKKKNNLFGTITQCMGWLRVLNHYGYWCECVNFKTFHMVESVYILYTRRVSNQSHPLSANSVQKRNRLPVNVSLPFRLNFANTVITNISALPLNSIINYFLEFFFSQKRNIFRFQRKHCNHCLFFPIPFSIHFFFIHYYYFALRVTSSNTLLISLGKWKIWYNEKHVKKIVSVLCVNVERSHLCAA